MSFEGLPPEYEIKTPEEAGHEAEPEPTPELAAEEIIETQKGIVDKIRELVNSKMQESKMPTKEKQGYDSTMGIYGGKLAKDEAGRMVYDTRGLWSKIDQWGDRVLRSFDEHHAKNPGAMFWRRPGAFLKLLPLIVDSKRYRGTPEQTVANAKRLGLDEYYGAHPWGVEIKKPELFSESVGLQDIYRQDEIGSPALKDIDRFEALGAAAEYVNRLHGTVGEIGEPLTASFLFSKREGNKVSEPVIAISSLTEVYNPEKHISEIEKKATDLLDLLGSAATEEYRRSQKDEDPWQGVRKALDTVLDRYEAKDVIGMVASYVKRGRLTLPGDTEGLDFKNSVAFRLGRRVFSAHNAQRLAVKDSQITPQLRQEIVDACERHAAN